MLTLILKGGGLRFDLVGHFAAFIKMEHVSNFVSCKHTHWFCLRFVRSERSFLSAAVLHFSCLAARVRLLFIFIDLVHNGDLIQYSFFFTLISLSYLAAMGKIQKKKN